MNIDETVALADELRLSYVEKKTPPQEMIDKLTEGIAKCLAHQKVSELKRVTEALGPLIMVCEARDIREEGRWRGLAYVGGLFRDYPQQLEIERWLHPTNVKRKILDRIIGEPGISFETLRHLFKDEDAPQELALLYGAGLLTEMPGKHSKAHFFVSSVSKRRIKQYDEERCTPEPPP